MKGFVASRWCSSSTGVGKRAARIGFMFGVPTVRRKNPTGVSGTDHF